MKTQIKMMPDNRNSPSDWKDSTEYVCSQNIEVFLTIFNIDFCKSSELIRNLGDIKAHRILEKTRNTIESILDFYENDVAKGKWKGDGVVAIFRYSEHAIAAAQKIIKRRRSGKIDQDVRIVIHKGPMIFKKDVGRSTSIALNCAERLHEVCDKNNIIITEEIYDTLEPKIAEEFQEPKEVQIKNPDISINIYPFSFVKPQKQMQVTRSIGVGKMNRVSFVADRAGKILQTVYEDDIAKLKAMGLGANVLDFAKLLSNKGKKVILIEQGDEPIISSLVLEDIVKKEEIEEKKKYETSLGCILYWEREVQLIHPIGIEVGYDWIIKVKCRID